MQILILDLGEMSITVLRMTTQEKIQQICEILRTLGEPGSAYQIAQMLSVYPSTIVRYLSGEIKPHSKMSDSIDTLHRVLLQSQQGNEQARRVLDAILGTKGLARTGVGGILMAIGMTWLVNDPHALSSGVNPCASSAEDPATRNDTSPRKTSSRRTRARKPSKKG
jgi:hypothetical protein